jgi:dephospho-CoA kinase
LVKIGGNVKIKKVAVTGGIASGKTTVCHMLQNLGACVVSADEFAHKLLSTQSAVLTQVTQLLGSEILTRGKIDRQKIAQKVFANPQLLTKLQEILHPKIFEAIRTAFELCCKKNKCALFVAEIPLLYETGFETFFDAVVVVEADRELCARRFQETSGYGLDEFQRRMQFQLPTKNKMARAEYVLMNNGTLDELEKQVEELYRTLTT